MRNLFTQKVKKTFYKVSKIPKHDPKKLADKSKQKYRWIYKAAPPVANIQDRFYAMHKPYMGIPVKYGQELKTLDESYHSAIFMKIGSQFRLENHENMSRKFRNYFHNILRRSSDYINTLKKKSDLFRKAGETVFPKELIGGMKSKHISSIIQAAYGSKAVFKTDISGFFKNTRQPIVKRALYYASKKIILHRLAEMAFASDKTSGDVAPIIKEVNPREIIFNHMQCVVPSEIKIEEMERDVCEVKSITSGMHQRQPSYLEQVDFVELIALKLVAIHRKIYPGVIGRDLKTDKIYMQQDVLTAIAIRKMANGIKQLGLPKIDKIKIVKSLLVLLHKEEIPMLNINTAAEELLRQYPVEDETKRALVKKLICDAIFHINNTAKGVISSMFAMQSRTDDLAHNAAATFSHRNHHVRRNKYPASPKSIYDQCTWGLTSLILDEDVITPRDHKLMAKIYSPNTNTDNTVAGVCKSPIFIRGEGCDFKLSSSWEDRPTHATIEDQKIDFTGKDGLKPAMLLVVDSANKYKGSAILPVSHLRPQGDRDIAFKISGQETTRRLHVRDLRDVKEDIINKRVSMSELLGLPKDQQTKYFKSVNDLNATQIMTYDNSSSVTYTQDGKDKVCMLEERGPMIDVNANPSNLSNMDAFIRKFDTYITTSSTENCIEPSSPSRSTRIEDIHTTEFGDSLATSDATDGCVHGYYSLATIGLKKRKIKKDRYTLHHEVTILNAEDDTAETGYLMTSGIGDLLSYVQVLEFRGETAANKLADARCRLRYKLSFMEQMRRDYMEALAQNTGDLPDENIRIRALNFLPSTMDISSSIILPFEGKLLKFEITEAMKEANEIDFYLEYISGRYTEITDDVNNHDHGKITKDYVDMAADFAMDYFTTTQNALPEGAITSPLLANYVLAEIMDEIRKDVDDLGGRLFTYMDDITVVFDTSVPNNAKKTLADIIGRALNKRGLRINWNKTKLILGKYKRHLFGVNFLKYNGPKQGVSIRLTRDSHRILTAKVKNMKHFMSVYKAHIEKTRQLVPTEEYMAKNYPKGFYNNSHLKLPRLLNRLNGQLAWAVSLSPQRYRPIKDSFTKDCIDVFRRDIIPLIRECSAGLIDLTHFSSKEKMDEVEAMFEL